MKASTLIAAATLLLSTSAMPAEDIVKYAPSSPPMNSFMDFGFNGLGIDSGSYYGYLGSGALCESEVCLPDVTITGNRLTVHATGGSFGSTGRYLVDKGSVGYGIYYEPPEDLSLPKLQDPAKCAAHKQGCSDQKAKDTDVCTLTAAQISTVGDITSLGAGVTMTLVAARLVGFNYGARAGLATYVTTGTVMTAFNTAYTRLCSANTISRYNRCNANQPYCG